MFHVNHIQYSAYITHVWCDVAFCFTFNIQNRKYNSEQYNIFILKYIFSLTC